MIALLVVGAVAVLLWRRARKARSAQRQSAQQIVALGGIQAPARTPGVRWAGSRGHM